MLQHCTVDAFRHPTHSQYKPPAKSLHLISHIHILTMESQSRYLVFLVYSCSCPTIMCFFKQTPCARKNDICHFPCPVCLLVEGTLMSYNQDKNSHPSEMWPTEESPVISNHGTGGEGEKTKDQKIKWVTGRTSVC